ATGGKFSGFCRTHAPDNAPSTQSSHESPIRLISCLRNPVRTVAEPGLPTTSTRYAGHWLNHYAVRRHWESLPISAPADAAPSRHRGARKLRYWPRRLRRAWLFALAWAGPRSRTVTKCLARLRVIEASEGGKAWLD